MKRVLNRVQVLRRLRALRMEIEREMGTDGGRPGQLSDEQACLLVDICEQALELKPSEVFYVTGDAFLEMETPRVEYPTVELPAWVGERSRPDLAPFFVPSLWRR